MKQADTRGRMALETAMLEYLRRHGPISISQLITALQESDRTPLDIRQSIWKLIETGRAEWVGRQQIAASRSRPPAADYSHITDAKGYPPCGGPD